MSFSNYEQIVIINNNKLAGVQSADGSYSINQKPVNIAGVGFVDAFVDSPMVGNFAISRKMTGKDPLLEKNIFGRYVYDEQDFDGAILYANNNKGFGFNRARISSYSVSCNIGEIPDIQTNLTVYGHMGGNTVNYATYVINTNSRYYPYNIGNYHSSRVYLGRRTNSSEVSSSWNDGTLAISYEQYESLPPTSVEERYTSIVTGYKYRSAILGKDAFVMDLSQLNLNEDEPIKYPDQSSIKITINDFQIDPISAFSFSRSISTEPRYALPRGSVSNWYNNSGAEYTNLEPIQIDTIYPIETDVNLTMIAEEYEIREIKDRLQAAPKSNIVIDICDSFNKNTVINKLQAYNARLIGETINSNINGELSISLTYKGFETKNR